MKNLSILIIDDDEDFLEIYLRKFNRLNIHPLISGSLPKAIEIITKSNIDLIFLDMKMPYQINNGEITANGGLYFIKQVKKISPATEIIIVTGFGTMKSTRNSFREGVFDYIEKDDSLFAEMQDIIARIKNKKKEQFTVPNAMVATQELFENDDYKDTIISIYLSGRWSVSDFNVLLKLIKNLYTFFLVLKRENLINISPYEYSKKLWVAIENGLFETQINSLIIISLELSSPGKIDLKGLGEPIKQLKELFQAIFLLIQELRLKGVEIKDKKKDIELKDLEIKKTEHLNNFDIVQNELDLEIKKIDVIKRKIDLLKSIGFKDDQILSVIGPLNQNIFDFKHLIESNKIEKIE